MSMHPPPVPGWRAGLLALALAVLASAADTGAQTPARSGPPAAADLLRAAEQTDHPGIRDLFLDLAVPHDRVAMSDRAGPLRIRPLASFVAGDPRKLPAPVTLVPLDPGEEAITLQKNELGRIRTHENYEEAALGGLEGFLRREERLSAFTRLQVAEQVLAAVLRFHVSEQQGGLRGDQAWKPLFDRLSGRLYTVRRDQVEERLREGDWREALSLVSQLVQTYSRPHEPAKVGLLLVRVLDMAWEKGSEEMRVQAAARLRALIERDAGGEVGRHLAARLQEKARTLFQAAREAQRNKEVERAQKLLAQTEQVWPDLEELRSIELNTRPASPHVLRVGVRTLPQHLSPLRAVSPSERWAVDLLFEGLLEARVSHPGGNVYYGPELAEGRARVVPRGRAFQLPRQAFWSDGRRLTAADIRYTVSLLRQGKGQDGAVGWREMLDEVFVGGDPAEVTVPLARGHLDPLALMTFKVVPQHAAPDSEGFAVKPVGSGPYRLAGAASGAKAAAFEASPSYRRRPGHEGLPRIPRIEMVLTSDPAKDFQRGVIDVLPDAAPEELEALGEGIRSGQLRLLAPEPGTVRPRIHFLAVNHRAPLLDHPGFRQALAHAIDRDALLADCFRGKAEQRLHGVLSGVYPVGSWAERSGRREQSPAALHDRDLAVGRLREALRARSRESVRLTLKYPAGSPAVAKAMQQLKGQVEQTLRVQGSQPAVVLELRELSPAQLHQDVEETHDFELAYYSFDYFDRTYDLWPLLGPAGRRGENYLGYHSARLNDYLAQARSHRQLAEVEKVTRNIHMQLQLDMPVIPLWQLDPLHVFHQDVKPVEVDPWRVFSGIERWVLDRGTGR